MATAFQPFVHQRPREWRRRVSIRARVRCGDQWADGHILNLSSEGMLLQYARPLSVGKTIEIRQEERSVPATVIWRQGFRTGLKCEQPLSIEDWMTASIAQSAGVSLQSTARRSDRQRRPRRDGDQWRALGRKLEYVAIAGVAASISMAAAWFAAQVLFEPLSAINAALR